MNRMDRREIVECTDLAALSLHAAEHFTALARARAAEHGRFTVALAGGATPRSLYALLATAAYRDRVPWAAVHLFFGDERCVPPDHPESNFRMVKESLLDQVPIPAAQVHRMQGEDPRPDAAAARYEDELRAAFGLAGDELPRFDLVLLGLGADGHTASLFPGSPALAERWRLVLPATVEGFVARRLTLTLPVLNAAARVAFLVAGRAKARALAAVVRGAPGDPALPAARVEPENGALLFFVDRAAAGLLHTG
jgi:6-phosphogluconolactonase